jgi:hypothetical protein
VGLNLYPLFKVLSYAYRRRFPLFKLAIIPVHQWSNLIDPSSFRCSIPVKKIHKTLQFNVQQKVKNIINQPIISYVKFHLLLICQFNEHLCIVLKYNCNLWNLDVLISWFWAVFSMRRNVIRFATSLCALFCDYFCCICTASLLISFCLQLYIDVNLLCILCYLIMHGFMSKCPKVCSLVQSM